MSVTILSGPVAAGKTTVGRELLALLSGPVAYIEGDQFWSFIPAPHSQDRREVMRIMMRSMTAATVPWARSGYEVILDFSMPPQFLPTARKILNDIRINYVVLCPSLSICESRAAVRTEGRIRDYSRYRDFYALFENASPQAVCDDEADARTLAQRIFERLHKNDFQLSD
jgi:chloramphenicol 3-O-phosphotransferase